MKIILVRHGESEGNKHRILAFPDTPLSELGHEQAEACANRLQRFEIDKIYSSPYLRAIQTCEHFSKDYEIEELIREHKTGFEGMSYDEYYKDPMHKKMIYSDPINGKVPNGESLREVYNRALTVREKFLKEGGNILCFSHGAFMSMFISTVFDDPFKSMNVVVKNAMITVIGEVDGKFYLEELNS